MPNQTSGFNLPYPTLQEPPNGPAQMQALAEAVDTALGATSFKAGLSTARPAHREGLAYYETDTDKIMVSDGTAWQTVWQKNPPSTDSGWIGFTYQNSWGTASGSPGYRKLNGVVYLRSRIGGGTLGQKAATLPVGYRPAHDAYFIVVQANNTLGRVVVYADGSVTPDQGGTAFVSLAGITFPADG